MSDINASYKLISYLKTPLQIIVPTLDFYPGDSAPESVGTAFVLYDVDQNTDYYIRGLNKDAMRLQVVHTNFDLVHQLTQTILNLINIDIAQGIITGSFVANAITYNIRYLETFAYNIGSTNDFFVNNIKYFAQKILIDYEYTVVTLAQ